MNAKMLTMAAVLAVFSSAACAGPVEGLWPPESKGTVQPKPKWIMVIPVVRDASGSISAWNRNDPWVRKWIVPKPVGNGIRAVTVTGDADDVRSVTGEQFDNMDTSALRRLLNKYGASAIAMVVAGDQGTAAVAAWTPGQQASWDVTRPNEDPKEGAMRILGELFSGPASSAQTNKIKITGVRTVAGVDQYRLEGRDWNAIDGLRGNRAIEILETMENDGHPTVIVRVTNGRTIEEAIGEASTHHLPATPKSEPEGQGTGVPDPMD